jgi:hypothetical protein
MLGLWLLLHHEVRQASFLPNNTDANDISFALQLTAEKRPSNTKQTAKRLNFQQKHGIDQRNKPAKVQKYLFQMPFHPLLLHHSRRRI